MKKLFFITALLSVIFLSGTYCEVKSQSIQFCEDVDSEGMPVSESTVFNISSKGGYLKFLVRLPYKISTSSVSYVIYKIDGDGNENYESTIYQDVEGSWSWFWKEVTFYDSGVYNIAVYDGDNNYLTSGQISIQYY
ncbi:MAG TPA: hypothetical protein PK294_06960 [Ignavibacteria bacterium]|nr:hypothetical protein [Ignavibacteria bacterium]